MQTLTKLIKFLLRQPRWRQITAVVILIAGGLMFRSGGVAEAKLPTFAARRGPLEITVLEGGSLEALESQEAKCEVRVGNQGTKILRIVEEGYLVTEADVKNGKVLVELDSSELESRISQQEIQYQQAVASLIDAQQNYEIQLNQNQSDINAAAQKARFARMDFDKFLGDGVSAQIIKDYGLDRILTDASTNDVETTARAEAATATTMDETSLVADLERIPVNPGTVLQTNAAPVPAEVPEPVIKPVLIDFSKYATLDALGDGEAKQKLRKFEDDLQAAQKEQGQAKATFEGTQRLFAKQFVAKNELVKDQLSLDSADLRVKTAQTASALFLKYDFPKTAEQSLSAYTDAVRDLDKARRVAVSKLAQTRARLRSAQGQYAVQNRQRQDLLQQLEKCTIRAQKSGLVVYGGSGESYYRNEEPIREGATIRERQSIITIPDMARMAVNVKIHESYIKKIKKGLSARITVDAFPETILTGEITKVSVLPDSQDRWMNPDMKVYVTTVTINGTYDWVKPGMSAKVEILVNKLDDAVYIPVQAVSPEDGHQYCYVANGFKPERREIEVGEFNDDFIEIKSGLTEGERVLLRLPDGVEAGSPKNDADSPAPKPVPEPVAQPNVPAQPAKADSSPGHA